MKVGDQVRDAHARLTAFGREYPEWVQEAHEAIRPWERSEELLLGAIAKALKAMYERGARGDYPVCNQLQDEEEAPRRRIVRRTPPYQKAEGSKPVVKRIVRRRT